MKNRLTKQIDKYSSGNSSEYYKTPKGQFHGPYKRIYSNGHKDVEGSFNFDRNIGIWKSWKYDGRRWRIITREDNMRNGATIYFN